MRKSVKLFLSVSVLLIIIFLSLVISKKEILMPKKNNRNHVILISVDALFSQDYEIINNLPNFRRFFYKGTVIREVRSIFPTLTYPIHASIITGVTPDKHGIINNIKFQPGEKLPEWYWYYKYINTPTIIDLLHSEKMTAASLFWPITANAKEIKYNLPEIWPVKGENQVLLSLRTGSPWFILKTYFKYGSMLAGTNQPNLDDFITAVAVDMIQNKKPNLTLIHLFELDMARHKYGTFSNEAKDSLIRSDERIGKIINAVKEAGIYDNTTIFVLGDHGFADVDTRVSINALFKNEDLIRTDEQGNFIDWKAYANYFFGGAYVYIKNKTDTYTIDKVTEILSDLKRKNILKNIWMKNNFSEIRVNGNFTFVAEATPGYYIVNDWNQSPAVKKINLKDELFENYRGIHGYGPDLPDYNTIFLAKGKKIKSGLELPIMNILDIAPTVAHLFGLEMPNADGTIIEEMIE